MSKAKHTPGPWWVSHPPENNFRFEVVDSGGRTVAVLNVSDEAMGETDDGVRLRLDAYLVAAAPSLYQACEALIEENGELRRLLADRAGVTHTFHAAREEAVAAIAEAEAGQ